ncbi:hypothetical protein [Pseudomonas sp. 37 R 15]|uniref:hypothetical protein n=1 Tax=Pseudomonas sp. 37 R 15 TaxID=1844104 RepID=UPI0009F4DDFB|nr:hypothetical protein [Pseudomonas sp. 37 R 15]
MIGIPTTGTLENGCISANVTSGYQLTTADGRPARLAIIDDQGNIVESGDTVAREAWNVCITVIKNFKIGQGHIVVHRSPPGLDLSKPKSFSAGNASVKLSTAKTLS